MVEIQVTTNHQSCLSFVLLSAETGVPRENLLAQPGVHEPCHVFMLGIEPWPQCPL